MLSPPLAVSLCGVNTSFCHGALEYLGGKTNWGKVMKYVFLKKLTGRQVSVYSFPALVFLLMLYVFSSGACCGGTGGSEAQGNYCWGRCFRVSCPLNTGSISLGLRGSRPVTFLAACYKNEQIHIRLVCTFISLLLSGSGEREINSLGIFNEIKFGTKCSSSQNDTYSIYIEEVVTVEVVVLIL